MTTTLSTHTVRFVVIDNEQVGQRIDNFLLRILKGVPKTRVYRMLRKGEVRVNSGRIQPSYRLQLDDKVRIPPVTQNATVDYHPSANLMKLFADVAVYEDSGLLVINKPSGIPVHGGSGVRFGVIEIMRKLRPELKFLELVHRLDKDTSGCLLLAKKRSVLVHLHALLREHKIHKSYLTLVRGQWQGGARTVERSLEKNVQQSGERVVVVNDDQGKLAKTVFKPVKKFHQASLMEAIIYTGRTHQIRVHASYLGRPIAGDEKYGDKAFNKEMRNLGLKRLFLHAHKVAFTLPEQKEQISIEVALGDELRALIERLE